MLCLIYCEWELMYHDEHCGGLPVGTLMIDSAQAMGYRPQQDEFE